jgi:hypothetical protein
MIYHFHFFSMDVVKATKDITAFTPEIDCDQAAIGLPPLQCSS